MAKRSICGEYRLRRNEQCRHNAHKRPVCGFDLSIAQPKLSVHAFGPPFFGIGQQKTPSLKAFQLKKRRRFRPIPVWDDIILAHLLSRVIGNRVPTFRLFMGIFISVLPEASASPTKSPHPAQLSPTSEWKEWKWPADDSDKSSVTTGLGDTKPPDG